jgi:hypothetical protein
MYSRRGALKESEFWCLASLLWLGYLGVQRWSLNRVTRSTISTLSPLILQILIYRWGQQAELHSLNASFWVSISILALCIATYMATTTQLIKHCHRVFGDSPYSALAATIGALSLSLVALTFKLAFTAEHTPALIPLASGQLQSKLRAIDQVLMAQTTFAGCFGGLGFIILHVRRDRARRADSSMSQAVPCVTAMLTSDFSSRVGSSGATQPLLDNNDEALRHTYIPPV